MSRIYDPRVQHSGRAELQRTLEIRRVEKAIRLREMEEEDRLATLAEQRSAAQKRHG
jgi:hypothetical protein